MLFPYKFTPHVLDKLHQYIAHTVLEVWCKANGPFSITLLHKDFQPLVKAVAKNKNDYLLKPIKAIYRHFEPISPADKKKIARGFKSNNQIEGLCDGSIRPMRYEDIEKISKPLATELNPFFKNLYTKLLGLKVIKDGCGELKEHYEKFMYTNDNGKCPFCGLLDIKSELLRVRDAYDHYLPKDIYPFNSINFKNLVPACHTCNSSYKLVNDPIREKTTLKRRKAFYPFARKIPAYKIGVSIDKIDSRNHKKNKLSVSFSSVAAKAEVAGWADVYGIRERYTDKCSSKDSKYWLKQMLDERMNKPGFDLRKYIRARKKDPAYLEYNFLRIPFLEGYIKYTGFNNISSRKGS